MELSRLLGKLLVLLTLGFINHPLYAQSFTESRADSLFARWDQPNSPGMAVGIIKDGELVFSKGYGMSNLEFNIPMTPDSPIYIGSMAKQFTAACILLLQQNGELEFSDPVTKFLPQFPHYESPITIENLLHHTSGIREAYSLLLFAGGNPDWEDHFDNDAICDLIYNQRSLNFKPGTEYNYSSGGYILLARIIEKISGQTLREFADDHIFRPLGMSHTHFEMDHAEIIAGRVESYRREGDHFARYNKNFDSYGDGGILTTVNDLVQWDRAFYKDLLGVPKFSEKMYKQGVLSNGHQIDYAMAVQVREYHRRKVIEHNGGMLGFRVDMVRWPEQNFTAIVLSNLADVYPTYFAYQLSDIYLSTESKMEIKDKAADVVQGLKVPATRLQQLAGTYWNTGHNFYVKIDFDNDSLYYDNTFGYRRSLIPQAAGTFAMNGSATSLRFDMDKADTLMTLTNPGANNLEESFRKYNATGPGSIDELSKFTGTYYSEELHTRYRMEMVDGKFCLMINGRRRIQLYPAEGNVVWNSKDMVWIGFAEIIFQKNGDNAVTGLRVGDSRVNGVWFTKVD